MNAMTQDERTALVKKFFPRVPWTDDGPVRRRYLARAVSDGDVTAALAALAGREGFTEPGQKTVTGGADDCLAAFRAKSTGGVGMIFGTETAAHWCDIAAGSPDADGWQPLIVRSEEGENLVALAHCEGILRFRRWE